jgi:hypothetical protein
LHFSCLPFLLWVVRPDNIWRIGQILELSLCTLILSNILLRSIYSQHTSRTVRTWLVHVISQCRLQSRAV